MPPTSPRLSARLLAAIWSIPACLSTFETVVFSGMAGRPMPLWKAFVAEAPGWYTWALLTPLVVRLGQRWRLDARPRGVAIALHLVFAIVAAALVATVNAAVNHYVRPNRFGFLFSARSWFLSGLPASVVAYFGILAISLALLTALQLRERERDAAELRAQLGEAQMSALRMQLNPHFLFNSLNAVMALVRDRATDEAVNALAGISDLLRTALRDQSHETSLGAELAFVERYLDVERVRFADRLTVRMDVPASLRDAAVPTFIMQPLVENALKHGVAALREGGAVRIAARTEGGVLELVVDNDGPPIVGDGSADGGVGLRNTRERLARLHGAAAGLTVGPRPDASGTLATLRLPLRRIAVPPTAAA
jgi:signal transduction histidine kinase